MTNDEQILKDLVSNVLIEEIKITPNRFAVMKHFPRLSKLCVINQKITSMKGIECCRSLQELWICEGQVAKIEGTE